LHGEDWGNGPASHDFVEEAIFHATNLQLKDGAGDMATIVI
jgi:hypothetical protein